VFLSEPLDGLQRWQMFMIIVTLVCSHLLVNIWMFYAKAARFLYPTRCLLRFLTRTILLSVFVLPGQLLVRHVAARCAVFRPGLPALTHRSSQR
jgi:hypothetical protein